MLQHGLVLGVRAVATGDDDPPRRTGNSSAWVKRHFPQRCNACLDRFQGGLLGRLIELHQGDPALHLSIALPGGGQRLQHERLLVLLVVLRVSMSG